MHELSIAQSLVELIEDELMSREIVSAMEPAAQRTVRVGIVKIAVGPLSGVVPEALASAFPVAIAQTSIRGATLSIEARPVVVHCSACNADHELPSPQRLRCPVCDQPTPDVIGGRELELVSIEVFDDAPPHP